MSVDSTVGLTSPTLWGLLKLRVALSPEEQMLVEAATGRTLTFGQFQQAVLDCAGWLQSRGVRPGSVVAWQLPTRIEAPVVCLALAQLGAVQVPVIHAYRERELGAVLAQSRPAFIVVPPPEEGNDAVARVRAAIDAPRTSVPEVLVLPAAWPLAAAPLPPPPEEGDVVRWHFYTSGTASQPKAVLHTDASLMAAGVGMASLLGMQADDVGSIAYPFAHIGGISYVAAALSSGMSVVLFERFVPAEMIGVLRRWGVTFAGGSTAHYQGMLAEQRLQPGVRLAPSLRVLAGGGAGKPASLFHQVKDELGCQVVHAYGLTESPISTFNTPGDTDEQLAHSDGTPLPGMEIRILRTDGQRAAPGETGEILLRGPNVCRGYLDAEATRLAFDAEGFLHTGDLGMLRTDGRLSVTGRLKDIIIRKGENISAREIEDLLQAHPQVRDVAVIGLPDEERGERVCAVVIPLDARAPLTFAQMTEFLKSHQLMAQKLPEQLEIVDSMPRNEALQKVVKRTLREQIIARGAQAVRADVPK